MSKPKPPVWPADEREQFRAVITAMLHTEEPPDGAIDMVMALPPEKLHSLVLACGQFAADMLFAFSASVGVDARVVWERHCRKEAARMEGLR